MVVNVEVVLINDVGAHRGTVVVVVGVIHVDGDYFLLLLLFFYLHLHLLLITSDGACASTDR